MTSSTLRPTRRRRLALTSLVAGIALAIGIVTPAAAAVTGGLAIGATTIEPGGSTSINATFDEDAAGGVLGGTVVNIVVTPGSGATGTVTLTAAAPCDDSAGTQVDCLWPTGTSNYAATITATASADAGGPFLVTTSVTGANADTPGDSTIVTRPVAGPQTLTVTPPTATFGAQSPTPAPPSSTLSSSVVFTLAGAQADIGVDLEGTGGEGTLSNFDISTGGSCVATSTRGFRCDWNPVDDPNTVTITFDVNVGAGATPPDWTLRAILDGGGSPVTLNTRSVVIEPQVTTTTTTTTTTTSTVPATTTPATTTPATTAAPTTAAPTTAAPSTAAPSTPTPVDELPATGPSAAAATAMIGALLLAGGLVVTGAARRQTNVVATDREENQT